jgi:hypothetical protein
VSTTAELDIYRIANILVKEYGAEQAPLMAAKRADALLEIGDVDGQQVWKGVLRAVQEALSRQRDVDAEWECSGRPHAASVADCHCAFASALKVRSVDRQMRWR